MAEHVSRKELKTEIKTDQFRETLLDGVRSIASHQKGTAIVLGGAAVILLAVFGWRTYAAHQTVKAAADYDAAMKIFQAPIQAPGTPAQPGVLTYADEKTKFGDAAQKFGQAATTYPRTKPGQISHYYAALALEKVGKDDDAKKWLQGLAGNSDADLSAMARFELAQIEDRGGQGDDAAKIYQDLIAKPSLLVPKPVVMLALAQHYREKNPTEAAKLYSQIKSDYPDSALAQQADQELSLLPGKS